MKCALSLPVKKNCSDGWVQPPPRKIGRYMEVHLNISPDILRSTHYKLGPVAIEIWWFARSGPEFSLDPIP